MTRKDYVLIAKVLRNYATMTVGAMDQEDLMQKLTYDFAVALKTENPSFDMVKFDKAVFN